MREQIEAIVENQYGVTILIGLEDISLHFSMWTVDSMDYKILHSFFFLSRHLSQSRNDLQEGQPDYSYFAGIYRQAIY
jgi:hypothetical protein